MDPNEISYVVIESAIAVHRELGPGLLESVYKVCLVLELKERGLHVESELDLPVRYRGIEIIEKGFRLDLLVENQLIVELKSVEKVQPVYMKQLLTYLRLTKKPLGLLINFNEALLKDGIRRVVNGL
jgi:GxxExxY protein